MNPEAADYLAKAKENLDEARKILAIGLFTVSSRSSYYAAFHAAEALIITLTGKIAKSHSGVHSEFARLVKETTILDPSLTKFLSKSYKYKETADYSIGEEFVITKATAEVAAATAEKFINTIEQFLTSIK